MAQALPAGRVATAVFEVAVASAVTVRPPPLRQAVTHSGALITRRQVAVARHRAFKPPVAPAALTPTGHLVTASAHRPHADTLARPGAGRRPPALIAGAVAMDGVALSVPGTLAGVLAQRTPAVRVAGALTCDRVAAAVGVALTHPATVWGPELRRTAW